MTRINLLPWREAQRQQQQRNFISMIALAAVLAGIGVFIVHLYVSQMISHQEARNDYLRDEIVKLNKIEREINEMRKSEERLRARLEVIQRLQRGRPDMVKAFDALVRRLPEDIYLASLSASGQRVVLKGTARTNNVVSDFMRELEQSRLFGEPRLGIVENRTVFEEIPASRFELAVNRVSQGKNADKENQ